MSEEQQVRITGTDIAAFEERLKQFSDSLPENERNVLGWLMQRAADAPDDNEVSGYLGSFSGGPGLAGPAAGFGGVSPTFQALGAQQIGRVNPGQLAGVSVVVGIGVMF